MRAAGLIPAAALTALRWVDCAMAVVDVHRRGARAECDQQAGTERE